MKEPRIAVLALFEKGRLIASRTVPLHESEKNAAICRAESCAKELILDAYAEEKD